MQENNPFAAPAALVEDAAPLPKGVRPRVVVIAVRLLWLSFGASVVTLGMDLAGEPAGETLTVVLSLIYLGLLALVAWLIVCTARGRNWARVVQLLLVVVGVLAWPFVPADPDMSAFEWFLGLGSTALDVVAMWLLFTRSASAWFR